MKRSCETDVLFSSKFIIKNVKHDITVVASHKTKKGDKFGFSTMPITVSDGPFVTSVTSVTFP